MKLPIQAQPVMRNVSSVKIYENQAKYVNASGCDSECGWMVAACTPAAIGGYGAYFACLGAAVIGIPSCRDCVSIFAEKYWEVIMTPPCIGPGCGPLFDL
jgi:hypothetical protein